MIIDNVPFYPNTRDGTHCFQATLHSIISFFEPKKLLNTKELDILTGKEPGMWTWATQTMIRFNQSDYQIINYEEFDYDLFSRIGKDYLVSKFGQEVADSQISHCNLKKEMADAADYYRLFGNPKKIPEIDDIKFLVSNGWLVHCNVNYFGLYGKKGYAGHSVLVIGFDDTNIILHDPGLPARPMQKICNINFVTAWSFPSRSNNNLIGFKK